MRVNPAARFPYPGFTALALRPVALSVVRNRFLPNVACLHRRLPLHRVGQAFEGKRPCTAGLGVEFRPERFF